MIKYGKILKMHEKDNPSPFCRASYLISNVGDMIKCYGRMLRFPDDAHIYQKEMELAMGDVIMQCRLIQVENDIKETDITSTILDGKIGLMVRSMYYATYIEDILYRKEWNNHKYIHNVQETIKTETGVFNIKTAIEHMLIALNTQCYNFDLNFEEIQHLGFIHTIERFEEFERRGWK